VIDKGMMIIYSFDYWKFRFLVSYITFVFCPYFLYHSTEVKTSRVMFKIVFTKFLELNV